MKTGYSYSAVIRNRAKRLRALADRTENVEQLEAIERDLEKLVGQARRVQAGRLVTSSPTKTEK